MVSIHRIPIVLYLTIRVLCFVFRFKREALHTVARFTIWGLRIAHPAETSNVRAHADMYNTTSIPEAAMECMDTPMAVRYLSYVYNTPTEHLRCFVFDRTFEIFLRFQIVKTKA